MRVESVEVFTGSRNDSMNLVVGMIRAVVVAIVGSVIIFESEVTKVRNARLKESKRVFR